MVFVIGGKVSEKNAPSLHHFLERLNLRSIHGRSVFCRLVDRAVALTEEDKRRYDAASISVLRRPLTGAKPRRFLFEVTKAEQPVTYEALTRSQSKCCAALVAQLDVAAGLLMLDASIMGEGVLKPDAFQFNDGVNSEPPAAPATQRPRFLRWGSVLPEPEPTRLSATNKTSNR